MKKLIAIVGPTGAGKTKLAFRLAQKINGEIVNADSRQVYRHMDIGTAKPTKEETALVPHHLVDIVNPDQDFSLAQYQQLASNAIRDIQNRGKLPLLVGGTGQYVWAVLEGWVIPRVPPDIEYRRSLEKQAKAGRAAELYASLREIDPVAAEKIDPRNVRRVIRALEVSRQIPFSQSKKVPPPFDSLIIGLTMERKELYQLVDARVDAMIARGFVDEVRRLLEMGCDLTLPAMSSIGYREIGLYLQGKLTLEEAVYKIKTGTHRFIRHQYAWFRLTDERIRWWDAEKTGENEVEKAVKDFSAGNENKVNRLKVRRYRDSDRDAVWELHLLGLDQSGTDIGRGPWEDDLQDVAEHYLNDNGEFLVGTVDGRIVAIGGLKKKSETLAEIKRMRVLPDYQRKDFGQAILNALEERAHQLGYRELCLDTTTKQVPAQKLYEKNGFVDSGHWHIGELEIISYRKILS
ncbi:MAG: tRNA (adenosine(37)-N6)-dimethylallyltransferase MiaA [Dehalococcoidia bacterium]|nr:tRNA (adenosine(37)-N6)-dimethylallyltransferase MiaA [Dehalococcoidia bacterium]